MNGVEFEESGAVAGAAPAAAVAPQKRGLQGLVMKIGLARTEHQANVVLLLIAILAFLAAGYLLYTDTTVKPIDSDDAAKNYELIDQMPFTNN